ncbi:MAG TPA: right-handed parallel beta-helix repeat-containing protein [Methylosinus sp.]
MKPIAWAVALAGLAAAPALAGSVSFVSVTGDDARSCATPATACRTFQRAHDATSPHGEIIALTPGDFRPVEILKSISVTGVEGAGIFGGADRLITVSSGSDIHLTGLTLDGAASAGNGVQFGTGNVTIRKCVIRNTVYSAVYARYVRARQRLLIEDSSLSSGSSGLYSRDASSLVHRVVVSAARNNGVILDLDGVTTISQSSLAADNTGISRTDPHKLFVTRSVVTGNSAAGVEGGFTSAGDNFIRGNGTNVSGTIANIGRQ